MEDLENFLFEAAGRTRHSRPTSRGGHGNGENVSSSDDEHEYPGLNHSGLRVPLKKRFDPKERYDGKGSQEEEDGQSNDNGDSNDEYDFGDDLYKNEDDRRKLSEMTELQREMILSNRATKKYDKDLLGKISSKREKGKKIVPGTHTSPPPSSRVWSSVARFGVQSKDCDAQ